MIPSYSIPVTRLFSVQFSARKTLLYGLDKFSLWDDCEATREARLVQAAMKGRKISAKLTHRCRGESSNSARVQNINASLRISFRKIKVIEKFYYKGASIRKP